MKFSCASLGLMWTLLRVLSALDGNTYFEEGKPLVLVPDISRIAKPNTIRWKFNSDLVVDWMAPDFMRYYGRFKNRATLNTQTLQLNMEQLSLSDSGTFSLETEHENVGSYPVKVIKPPPVPSIEQSSPECVPGHCTLRCTADTRHLGPHAYHWRRNEGEWTKGDERLKLNVTDVRETYGCRLVTDRTLGPASGPMDNPLYKPLPLPERPEPPPTPSIEPKPPSGVLVFLKIMFIFIGCLVASLLTPALIINYRPENLSVRLLV